MVPTHCSEIAIELKPPLAYAEKAEMDASPAVVKFNCAQRENQQHFACY
jgi:hypothetical protein